jgi:hypothetical protein
MEDPSPPPRRVLRSCHPWSPQKGHHGWCGQAEEGEHVSAEGGRVEEVSCP